MKDETTDNLTGSVLSDLVVTKLKDIGVRAAKLKKIKYFLQKQDEKELPASKHMFGIFLSQQQSEKNESGCLIPRFLKLATTFLSAHSTAENIFRKNGLLRRQRELKKALEEGGTLEGANVDDVASLLKQWFRELPEPIIPFTYHDLFFKCHEICKERNNQIAVLLACLLLPNSHLNALKHALRFLAMVASQSNVNHMDSWNLGVVMAPNFLPLEKDVVDKNEKASNKIVQHQTELIQMLIDHANEVGTLPSCHLEVPIPSEEEEIGDPTFRRKKRKSMHEVVDCLRKRVVQTPSTRESENVKKPLTRSGSKRKGEPLPQPSPCKKWANAAISIPAVQANSSSSTPLHNRLHNLSIHDTVTSVYASPTPRKGFGLLRRRSRFRKSKCFTTPYKRNTRKTYNNQACLLDSNIPKAKPDVLLKNELNNFNRKLSPKINNVNTEQQPSDLPVKDAVQQQDPQTYGDHGYAIPVMTPRHDEVSQDTETPAGSPAGPEVSVNSTDSDLNVPVQFADIESSARKMCLRRGRPNTLKMGLKSPFVPRSCSEPADLPNISMSRSVDPIDKISESSKSTRPRGLMSPLIQRSFSEPGDLSNISTSPLLESIDKMSEVSQLSESTGSSKSASGVSSSSSDSSLRRFLTENILNALSFSSLEFSMGSTSEGKPNEIEPAALNPVDCNPEMGEQQRDEGVETAETSMNFTDGKLNENELVTPDSMDRDSRSEERSIDEVNVVPERSLEGGRPKEDELPAPDLEKEEQNGVASSELPTEDFVDAAICKTEPSARGDSYLNSWSQYNFNGQNPFSVNDTFASDIGPLPSLDSISNVGTPGKDLDSPDHRKEESSTVPNVGAERTLELAALTSPAFDGTEENTRVPERVSGLASSTPVQRGATWMNEKEFKALLDNVPESEGTKRESILKIRVLNAGRVRANVQHYDKIACPRGSPHPDGAFARNGLVTRSVRCERNVDSQGFVVPKGIPSSIKRCTRSMRSTAIAACNQESPLRRRGSNVRLTRSADKVRPNNPRNLTPLRSKLYFGDEGKENGTP